MSEPKICEPGGAGFLFPALEAEQHWYLWVRTCLYTAALCWLFLGISIVADKFVASIEAITSQKKRVRIKSENRVVTYKLWNETVANLTLMALGSSAPEILLSIIETVKNGFHSGELGPSTIVGSAAFNLFMIIAVCIVAVPAGEIRSIKATKVFYITAAFSLVAYLWLVVIVSVVTPDSVDIWEGLVTLLMMPVLVYVSYLADIGRFDSKADTEKKRLEERDSRELDRIPMTAHQHHPNMLDARPAKDTACTDMLMFEKDTVEVVGTAEQQVMQVCVFRRNGTNTEVACKYRTEQLNAVPGYDYVHDEGDLLFAPGTTRATIPITILPKSLMEHSDKFQLVLEDLEGGACFNPNDDGGSEQAILTVTILNESDALTRKSIAARAITAIDGKVNIDSMHRGTLSWFDAVKSSITLAKEDEDGTPCKPTAGDYLMHVISLPWQLGFALTIPPTEYMGGWPCFVFALGMIGFLTGVVCDFAELLGCVLNVPDSVVAISFVALGTSMPDLFASKTAAVDNKTADASIVNVTGSNCVNVFLGIGLPWSISAIYWAAVGATSDWKLAYPDMIGRYPSGAFVVRGGDLAFSVVVFTICAIVALGLIQFRRVKFGGELGGPRLPAIMSSLLMASLWVFYLVLSIWKTFSPTVSSEEQFWMIVKALFFLQVTVVIMGGLVAQMQKTPPTAESDVENGTAPPLPPPVEPPKSTHIKASPIAPVACGAADPFRPPPSMHQIIGHTRGHDQTYDADEAVLRTITVAAMTSWAAAKMKANAGKSPEQTFAPPSRQPTTFLDAESPRSEIERVPSFHSIHTQAPANAAAAAAGATPQRTPRGSLAEAGRAVADGIRNHAADWVTLSVAGWLAAQAAQAADPAAAGLPQ